MEATLPSWVKCTDPIPREILEEVRSTVLVWMKNVRNYCTKLYEDLGSPQWFQSPDHPILIRFTVPFDDEAGLGRGEGGSERIREDPRGLGKGGWS